MGIRENIRKEIARQGYTNLSDFCRKNNLSIVYLNQFLNKKRRYNEDMINKISRALKIPIPQLFSEHPLVPYEDKEPRLIFNSPEGDYEGIKLFSDPISLGPGYELSEMAPEDYIPIPKAMLPKGWKSDKDRIVAFWAKGISMKPTINDGSIVWIDRMDVVPKIGEIYAFLLKDFGNFVTIKRLIKIYRHLMIIDGDNTNAEDRKSDELKDYPMVLDLKEYEHEELTPIRGRVIWVLNRLIEKSK